MNERELPEREPPPGHGEPGEGYARPGHDPRCWCGRPLYVVGRTTRYYSCPEHGVRTKEEAQRERRQEA